MIQKMLTNPLRSLRKLQILELPKPQSQYDLTPNIRGADQLLTVLKLENRVTVFRSEIVHTLRLLSIKLFLNQYAIDLQ